MTDTHLEDLADRIQPKAVSNLLLWLIFGFFVLFVIWAALSELDRTVHAPGRVVPSSRLQVVSNLEGGIVSQILVHAGDIVRRGQSLVLLDQTQAGADFGSSEATVGALSAKIARLEAEIAGRDPIYPAPTSPAMAEQIGIERSLHAARIADLASLTSGAAARESGAQRAVSEARSAYQSRVTARDTARRQLDLIRPLVERGIEPQATLIQLENDAAVSGTDAARALRPGSARRARRLHRAAKHGARRRVPSLLPRKASVRHGAKRCPRSLPRSVALPWLPRSTARSIG
jgi:adhesin transport system membrane fusion protein